MKDIASILKLTDPFFEKIGQLSKLHRILICIATLVVIVGLFVYFFYLPKYDKLKQIEEEYKTLEKKLIIAKKKAATIDKYRSKMKKAEKQFNLAMSALPDKKEVPSLLTNISQSGKEAGLEFLLFQPENEVEKDFYSEIPVSIVVTGNYHNVGVFFDKVSNLSRIVNIKNIRMFTSKDSEELNTACLAVTYRFIEEDEKESTSKKQKS